ncbi:cell wall binding repeat family protein [Actinomyces sp. Chiba101]|uniref:CAP domain-containing protein n=1 Tax=Actinomyces TaxID=1654 RepID=UPI000974E14C|nr:MULTISPECIES: CAP domain-containing protein [Actinomyces]BAW94166.1 cell wall binding repeat family protein [Actinomyces sp. Chiba101]SUU13523.1 Autolysin [Actinomyces denticolens]
MSSSLKEPRRIAFRGSRLATALTSALLLGLVVVPGAAASIVPADGSRGGSLPCVQNCGDPLGFTDTPGTVGALSAPVVSDPSQTNPKDHRATTVISGEGSAAKKVTVSPSVNDVPEGTVAEDDALGWSLSAIAVYEQQILDRVNQLRVEQGLNPVKRAVKLDTVARDWSAHMASYGVGSNNLPKGFHHHITEKGAPENFWDLYPSGWGGGSENIAWQYYYGYKNGNQGYSLFNQWLHSPGHLGAMLDPSFTHIGIAVHYDGATHSWYATQNFALYRNPANVGALTPPAGSQVGVSSNSFSGSRPAAAAAPARPAPVVPQPTGWVRSGSTWHYIDPSTGVKATGWRFIGGSWYFLRPGGAMATGWIADGGSWYFMDASGAMRTGWIATGGHWYYLKSGGAMATGWIADGGSWYFMDASGAMRTGWIATGGHWYYLKSGGAMATGWIADGGKWYFLDASGAWVR